LVLKGGQRVVADNKRDTNPTYTAKTTTGDEVTVKKNIDTIAKYNGVIQSMMNNIKSVSLSTDRRNEQKLDDFNEKIKF
jgi:hypothetical protein